MAYRSKLEDLDLTSDEIKRLGDALQKEEFRKLLVEYAEEISNPANKKKYEEEISQLENERGMDVTFVHPEPGHVLKTSVDGDTKAFINVCKNDNIAIPSFKKAQGPNGRFGFQWSLPHSLSQPRDDLDKSGKRCKVYDVVFHPDTYRMSETNPKFRKLVNDAALEAVEENFDVKLDKKNVKQPKMKCKGRPPATVIRTRRPDGPTKGGVYDEDSPLRNMPYPYDDTTTAEKSRKRERKLQSRDPVGSKSGVNAESSPVTPKYSIVHRSEVDLQEYRNAPDARPSTRPKALIITIDLPLLNSAGAVDLDIFENQLILNSIKPVAYNLSLKLPYPVDENNGTAKFDKSKRQLRVILPVVPSVIEGLPFVHNENTGPAEPAENPEPPREGVVNGFASSPIEPISEETNTNLSESDESEKERIPDKKTDRQQQQLLPPFTYQQDNETVTFIIGVRNIISESLTECFPEENAFFVKFTSQGPGCFPIHYKFHVQFSSDCFVSGEQSRLDVSGQNMVALLMKDRNSRRLWDGFLVGTEADKLEKRQFTTETNLKRKLNHLEDRATEVDCVMPETKENEYTLNVTNMTADQLCLEVQASKTVSEFDNTDNEAFFKCPQIEVVHRKSLPDLHGILKQRSHTTSESSDDNLSSCISPDSSSAEYHFPLHEKKSVSFNEHVDRTLFKPNSTVCSMKTALKSKRKRMRQKEERKKNGRRRHNSTGQESSEGEDHGKELPRPVQRGRQNRQSKVKAEGTAAVIQRAVNRSNTNLKKGSEDTDSAFHADGLQERNVGKSKDHCYLTSNTEGESECGFELSHFKASADEITGKQQQLVSDIPEDYSDTAGTESSLNPEVANTPAEVADMFCESLILHEEDLVESNSLTNERTLKQQLSETHDFGADGEETQISVEKPSQPNLDDRTGTSLLDSTHEQNLRNHIEETEGKDESGYVAVCTTENSGTDQLGNAVELTTEASRQNLATSVAQSEDLALYSDDGHSSEEPLQKPGEGKSLLSWETNCCSENNYQTQCCFQFSNNVMYELD